MTIRDDRSSQLRPGLTLGLVSVAHAAIHAQSALLPLVYAIVIVEFGLSERDIGVFIAITTAVGGTMQLAYGFLTRYVARPVLLAGGQIVFGAGLLVGGLSQSIGQLLGAISLARVGASPQHPVGNALLSDIYPPERRGFAISAHISGGDVKTVTFVDRDQVIQAELKDGKKVTASWVQGQQREPMARRALDFAAQHRGAARRMAARYPCRTARPWSRKCHRSRFLLNSSTVPSW